MPRIAMLFAAFCIAAAPIIATSKAFAQKEADKLDEADKADKTDKATAPTKDRSANVGNRARIAARFANDPHKVQNLGVRPRAADWVEHRLGLLVKAAADGQPHIVQALTPQRRRPRPHQIPLAPHHAQ